MSADALKTSLPKAAWVAGEPTPFHMALFDLIRKSGRIDIEFSFCAQHIDQPWALDRYDDLIAAESKARAFSVGRGYFNPAIVAAVAKRHWDVVVFSGYSQPTMLAGILACVLRGVPFILQGDTHLLKPRAWIKRVLKRLVLYPLLRRCGAAMGTGTLAKKYWESMGIPEQRVFVVPFTCHLTEFAAKAEEAAARRAKTRRAWGLPERGLVGIFVGRLLALKRVDLVLRALAAIGGPARPHLLVVGDGPERAALESLARTLGVGATFAGFQQNCDLPALYGAADFFVLPSGTEAWGVVVAEAACAGLPLLISHHAGAAYDFVEDDKNGWIVREDSPAAWSAAIERLRRKPERLAAMGDASRAKVGQWEPRRVVDAFFQAVDAAIGRAAMN